MKEYFMWVCHNLTLRWGLSEDIVENIVMGGKVEIPEDLSLQNYIKMLKEEENK